MTGARWARAVAAELDKLRTLPAVLITAAGTVATAVVLAAALAAGDPPVGAVGVALRTVPFLQVGTVVLGVVAVASEYAGRQVRTTLTAVPARGVALTGKIVAFLVAAAGTSAAAVAAAIGTAWLVLGDSAGGAPAGEAGERWWPVAGAVGYLVLIGLLAHLVATLLRSLVPPLVTVLGTVLVGSPLLAAITEHARWLPDRAGGLLYLPDRDPLLTPGTGALVLAVWITVAGVGAAGTFLARDA